ncbi:MAG: glycosyltransferase [Pseudomonadota bacterium]
MNINPAVSENAAENSKRTWLILAHCFNMDGRAASQTITDRLPSLMAKGIVPVVLSAPTGDKDLRFPHFQIFSPAPSGVLFELRHIIKKKVTNRFAEKFLKAVLTIACLPFYIAEKIFIHLDSQWSWFISASAKGYYLLKKYRPELIYSTAGPPSTHVAGFILHKLSRKPWLAEVHDPLIYDNERPKWQNYWFKRWLEGRICNSADAVVYFTEKALYSARGRNRIRGRAYVLRPGADPPDFSGVTYEKQDKIHFGHFGSLAEGRNLSVFIRALHDTLKENPEWRDKIRLDVYGTELDFASRSAIFEYALNDTLCEHGRLEYDPATGKTGRRQVLEAMRRCDVLLLIHGTDIICEEYIPSKVYEYLVTSRPILGCVLPDSELGDILTRNGHTPVNGDSVDDVRTAIKKFVLRWESEGLPDHTVTSPYTVERAVKQLLDIIDGF